MSYSNHKILQFERFFIVENTKLYIEQISFISRLKFWERKMSWEHFFISGTFFCIFWTIYPLLKSLLIIVYFSSMNQYQFYEYFITSSWVKIVQNGFYYHYSPKFDHWIIFSLNMFSWNWTMWTAIALKYMLYYLFLFSEAPHDN